MWHPPNTYRASPTRLTVWPALDGGRASFPSLSFFHVARSLLDSGSRGLRPTSRTQVSLKQCWVLLPPKSTSFPFQDTAL